MTVLKSSNHSLASTTVLTENPAETMMTLLTGKRTHERSRRSRAIKFPVKLMYALDCGSYGDIIAWSPSGVAFFIFDTIRFEKKVLPELFKDAKFSSFDRKIKRWGFLRANRGSKRPICYGHPNFQRGEYDLCMKISCSSVSSPSNQIRNPLPLEILSNKTSTTLMLSQEEEMVNNNHILNNFGAAGTGGASTISSTTSNTSTRIPNWDLLSSETTSTSHSGSAAVDMLPTTSSSFDHDSPFFKRGESASIYGTGTKHFQFAATGATANYKGSDVQVVSPSYFNTNNSYNLRKDGNHLPVLEDDITSHFPRSSATGVGTGGNFHSSTMASTTRSGRNQQGSYVNEQPSLARKLAYEKRHMIFQESNSSSNFSSTAQTSTTTPFPKARAFHRPHHIVCTTNDSFRNTKNNEIDSSSTVMRKISASAMELQGDHYDHELEQIKDQLALIRRRGRILKQALTSQMGHSLPELDA